MAAEESLIQELRAIVISSKGGISMRDLKSDFFGLNGTKEMYENLGFRNLEDYIYARPNEFRMRGGLITAALREESSHIQKLVNQQGGKRRGRPPPLSAPSPGRRPAKRWQTNNRPISRSGYGSYGSQNGGYGSNARSYAPQPLLPSTNNRSFAPPPLLPTPSTRSFAPQFAATANQRVPSAPTPSVAVVPPPKQPLMRQNSVPSTNGYSSVPANPINGKKVNDQTVSSVTLTSFKAKETAPREQYRHNSLDDDDDDGEIFKVVPPLEEKVTPAPRVSNHSAPPSATYPPAPAPAPSVVHHSSTASISSTVSISSTDSISPPAKYNMPTESQLMNRHKIRYTGSEAPTIASKQEKPLTVQLPSAVQQPSRPVVIEAPSKNAAYSRSRIARIQPEGQVDAEKKDVAEVTSRNTAKQDNLVRFIDLCDSIGLPEPDYKMLTHDNGMAFKCLVKVGKHVISSDTYTSDAEAARNLAISKAFLLLRSEQHSAVDDKSLFVVRLRRMLERSLSGIWMSQLPTTYHDMYGVPIPADYVQLIAANKQFVISSGIGRLILSLSSRAQGSVVQNGVGNSGSADKIPSPSTQGTVKTPEADVAVAHPKNQHQHNPSLLEAASVPLPLSPDPTQKRLPPLITPDSIYWDLYILVAEKPYEIIARMVGKEYSDAHDEVMATLEIDMMGEAVVEANPVEGGYYAVSIGSWSRVRLEKLLPDHQASVYFIDDGEDEIVDLNQIYVLQDKFLNHPPQAFKLSLHGLEAFPLVPRLREVMTATLCRKICVCEVTKLFPTEENDRGIRAAVVLWDTSSEEDINVNLRMMQQVVAAFKPPALTLGSTREMIVSQVGDKGVHLQSNDMSTHGMACFIDYVLANVDEADCIISKIVIGKIYLAKDPRMGMKQRVTVLEAGTEENITVSFIDYGTTGTVSRNDLFDAAKMNLALDVCPPLAITVKLSGIGEMTPEKVCQARLAVPTGQMVVVKVTAVLDKTPSVEMYRRGPDQSNQALQSINQILRAIITGNSPELEPESADLVEPAMAGLAEPTLPSPGDLVYINVVLSANPQMFTVQIIDLEEDQIRVLMDALQNVGFETAPTVGLTSLRLAEYYAAYYADDWYRAKLLAVISSSSVSVELCDYGNLVAPLPVEHLRKLPPSLRILPRQAIKASLAGVAPAHGDWAPADCVFFQEQVQEKLLAAYTESVSQTSEGPVLNLRIIDTSDPKIDVDIAQLLKNKGMAVSAPISQ